MPEPITIEFIADDKGVVSTTDEIIKKQKDLEKTLRDSAEIFGNLSSAQAKTLVPTDKLINASGELTRQYREGTISASELNDTYAKLAKETLEVQEAQEGVAEATKGADEENETLSKSISKVRTAWGKYLFIAGAVTGAVKLISDSLEDYIDAIEKTPELFSSSQLKNAIEFEGGVDALSDSFTKLKISIIDAHAPTLAYAANALSDGVDKALEYDEALATLESGVEKFGLTVLKYYGIRLFDNKAVSDAKEVLSVQEDLYNSTLETARLHNQMNEIGIQQRLDFMKDAGADSDSISGISIFDVTEGLQDQTDRFNEQQDNMTEKMDDTLAKIEELTRKGYGRWGEEIQGLLGDYDDLNEAMGENTAEHEENTQRRILDRAKELLSADELTTQEELYLIERGKTMGLFTQEVATEAQRVVRDAERIAEGFTEMSSGFEEDAGLIIDNASLVGYSLDKLDGRIVHVSIVADYQNFGAIGLNDALGGFVAPGDAQTVVQEQPVRVPIEQDVNANLEDDIEAYFERSANSPIASNSDLSASQNITIQVDTLNSREDLDYLAQEIGRRIR